MMADPLDRRSRPRGRPPESSSSVTWTTVHVRIPDAVLDAFCREALTADVSLHRVLQRALIAYVAQQRGIPVSEKQAP
jgi:hypothetical protein